MLRFVEIEAFAYAFMLAEAVTTCRQIQGIRVVKFCCDCIHSDGGNSNTVPASPFLCHKKKDTKQSTSV